MDKECKLKKNVDFLLLLTFNQRQLHGCLSCKIELRLCLAVIVLLFPWNSWCLEENDKYLMKSFLDYLHQDYLELFQRKSPGRFQQQRFSLPHTNYYQLVSWCRSRLPSWSSVHECSEPWSWRVPWPPAYSQQASCQRWETELGYHWSPPAHICWEELVTSGWARVCRDVFVIQDHFSVVSPGNRF